MQKIINYCLAIDNCREAFEELINKKIIDGWQPIGGVSVGEKQDYSVFLFQAMVKYEEFPDTCSGPTGKTEIVIPPKPKKEPKQIDPEYLILAEHLLDLIKTDGESKNIKVSDTQKTKWANEFRLMVDQDGFEVDWIRVTLTKVFKDPGSGNFAWKYVIRSASKFREHVKAGKLDHLFAMSIKKGIVGEW
jgi:hypothetical protein